MPAPAAEAQRCLGLCRAFAVITASPKAGRRQQPAQPERGRKQFGHTTGVTDLLGSNRAQRGHRRAVIAVLGVIVVLNIRPPAWAQARGCRAPFAGKDNAGRKLGAGVRRDGGRGAAVQLIDRVGPQAALRLRRERLGSHRLLALMVTADELVVVVDTVKKHVGHILGASWRRPTGPRRGRPRARGAGDCCAETAVPPPSPTAQPIRKRIPPICALSGDARRYGQP